MLKMDGSTTLWERMHWLRPGHGQMFWQMSMIEYGLGAVLDWELKIEPKTLERCLLTAE